MAAATSASSLTAQFVGLNAKSLQSSKASLSGRSLCAGPAMPAKAATRIVVSCKAESSAEATTSRRAAILSLTSAAAAVAALTLQPNSAEAAYGEAANIFGAVKKNTDYIPYAGKGFRVDIPSKWNPSPQKEFEGTVLRYEDNGDSVSNFAVIKNTAEGKSKIEDFGSTDDFLNKYSYLLGEQSYAGATRSEGGFDKNKVAAANVFEKEAKTVGGKTYYAYELLTRSADGNEGGRHQFITATVNNGELIIFRAQAGEKRWFKGAEKTIRELVASFSAA
ncbi:hypothetical protein CBR_g259 [Chara braunii]|uniref:23 kDa subunit of oxygen evolving system of photosystem II n=1 Tax=Chara braunii TaxID=69332 RepID=A0A388JM13_CHABU|nr:hypothetical protein CBR_g259 [Chara braunii]|eukprot:GBG58860.1 hypothetical protein CBR_g259 [Chara braunii]